MIKNFERDNLWTALCCHVPDYTGSDQPALQVYAEEGKFSVNYRDGESTQTLVVDATGKDLIIAAELLQLLSQLAEHPLS